MVPAAKLESQRSDDRRRHVQRRRPLLAAAGQVGQQLAAENQTHDGRRRRHLPLPDLHTPANDPRHQPENHR